MPAITNTQGTSFHRGGAVGESASTSAVSTTQHAKLEGVSVTAANMSAVSFQQLRNISNMRNNPASLETLRFEAAHRELAALQNRGASPLEIAAQKLFMQGLAQQQFPDLGSSSAYLHLNRFAPTGSPAIQPPLNFNDFTGSEIEKKIDRFTATDSLYKEVLALDLPDDKKNAIQTAYTTFKSEVRQAETSARQTVKEAEAIVADAEEQLKTYKALPDSVPGRAEQVETAQRTHDEAKAWLADAKRDLEQLTKNAVAGIFLNETIAGNKPNGAGAMASAMFGAALPQAILSSCHFGGTKAFTDASMAKHAMPTRVVTSGVALGIPHKILNDAAKPIVQYGAEKLGGRGVKTVPAESVYPAPARVVTKGGQVYRRTDEEFKALNDANNEKRSAFKSAQADNKFGTLKGDVKGFASFGVAHALIRGSLHAIDHPVAIVAPQFRTAASALGGAIMAGWQAYGQLTQKVDGRHTHLPADRNPNWAKTWDATKAGAKNAFDIRNPAVRKEYLSRMAGSALGAAASTNLSATNRTIDTSTTAGKIGFVAATATESTSMLQPFFSANLAGAEAKAGIAAGEYKDKDVARFTNALENIKNPDRPTVNHGTQPGTIARAVENAYHVTRGVSQVPSQMVAVAGETIVGAAVDQGGKLARKVADTAGALFSTPPATANVEVELNGIVIDGGEQTGPANPPAGTAASRFERPNTARPFASQSESFFRSAMEHVPGNNRPFESERFQRGTSTGATLFDSALYDMDIFSTEADNTPFITSPTRSDTPFSGNPFDLLSGELSQSSEKEPLPKSSES